MPDRRDRRADSLCGQNSDSIAALYESDLSRAIATLYLRPNNRQEAEDILGGNSRPAWKAALTGAMDMGQHVSASARSDR